MKKKGVLIVEDHPVFRFGLAELVNATDDMEVCGEASDIPEALEILSRVRPDMVIVDLALKGRSGMDLLKDENFRDLGVPALVVSMHDESLYAERAIAAGALGYVMKLEASDRILTALRSVQAGKLYLSDRLMAELAAKMVGKGAKASELPIQRLTDRELEILGLIAEGKTSGEIAQKLSLSVKTVGAHREHIKDKLNLKTASELTLYAIEWFKKF